MTAVPKSEPKVVEEFLLILSCPDDEPERLTSREDAKDFFISMIKKYHPDVNDHPSAKDVFIKLRKLQKLAIQKLAENDWNTPGEVKFYYHLVKKNILFRYIHKRPFELGTAYMARGHLLWNFKSEFKMIYDNLPKYPFFNYSSPSMKKDFEQLLPYEFSTSSIDGGCNFTMRRPDNSYPLSDVLNRLGGTIDPKHVAWIINRLYSISCYLQWAGLTHNDISLSTVFVNPGKHWCYLLGGWQYHSKVGKPLSYLPTRTILNLSQDTKTKKIAVHKTDLNLVRLLARELLGSQPLPTPMEKFFKYTSSGDAITDFGLWQEMLLQSFGARRFVELKVNMENYYEDR